MYENDNLYVRMQEATPNSTWLNPPWPHRKNALLIQTNPIIVLWTHTAATCLYIHVWITMKHASDVQFIDYISHFCLSIV